jgi:hypothetical protein
VYLSAKFTQCLLPESYPGSISTSEIHLWLIWAG